MVCERLDIDSKQGNEPYIFSLMSIFSSIFKRSKGKDRFLRLSFSMGLLCSFFFIGTIAFAGIEEAYWDPVTASNGEEVFMYAKISESVFFAL